MISVKEYAESRGKSIQAVHQQRKRAKYKDKLVGHEVEKDGIVWLDEVAVEVLDLAHNSSVAVVDTTTKEKLKKLERKLEVAENRERNLLNELTKKNNQVIELQNKLLVQTEQTTALALEFNKKTLLLDQKKELFDIEMERLEKEKNKEIERLKRDLEEERNKSFWKKLFKK